MKFSEQTDKIAPALIKAQSEIRGAVKDSKNPFHKTTYAQLASVIDACKQQLNDAGIAVMQSADAEGPDGCISIETRLIHASGQWVMSVCHIPVGQKDAQKVGAAITYGRRYGLQALMGIPSEDDDGNALMTSRGGQRVAQNNSGIGASVGAMMQQFAKHGIDEKQVIDKVGRKSISEITPDDIVKLRGYFSAIKNSSGQEQKTETERLKSMLADKKQQAHQDQQ